MKILLYFENEKMLKTSGIGRAMKHQMEALESQGIEYTTDPDATDYDILHVNTYMINSSRLIAKAKKEGKKVVVHAHSTEEDFRDSFVLSNQLSPIFKKIIMNVYSQGDYILTPTPYSKKILESYGLTQPIEDISNGIDICRFDHDEEKIKAFRKYFSLKADDKVVISVGLYFERKGILDFVEVAKQLPEYKFIWFGHTPLYTIPKHIRDVIQEDHPTNVLFPGYVKGAVIEGAFSGSDAFFFPSNEETEGIVVLEALASHQNVIVRDIPVFDPWLVDKVNCYKGKDNDEFKQLVEGVVEATLPSTKEAGRKTAEERSISQIGVKLKGIYEKVLKQ
ncbi:1,2-diacylglycerol-3-alpha-glucose alpha-1,2-glucosyltransferase [Breznakia sp. PF5-3]|uniref:glycosyltransferase family 4 protein n=1 Tax=unclassified Breznakia TaxID=2623764 RepID=UPI0024076059|nr:MULTISPECIES: glycosyltransferase [unclassified Breznakia]MDF9824001.1 1,2-diacylglycerol-3-alpha-glucose alpha-1,2-glucosyltransferase [Breznakia sp. PM6-1]MDF9834800.1 1,2-diacylglycerol-3-alpha-glucose alpha-1,2-glucosyltransferase [Breznakia sp. PF5-3]MDF9838119.1 1,2-diacylglycerol-3-alpha-glucose alpha-1,2-glucosyltransferase [Breznakia sp. PFB2-8]MDF9860105.1 1,2-diacylglycerol-3-alpha-glucose alpha-1,2-glucosyltransferase [Breznakia sp. PH5-24]